MRIIRSDFIILFLLYSAVLLVSACSSSRSYTLQPVKTFDPDNKDIPPPAETEEHFAWETLYYSTFYQLEKPLDLGRSGQVVGRWLGLNGADESKNVNVLDEVPNSSWYTRRHYFEPMGIAELKRGPNTAGGPDTSQTLTVISGKSEGVTPGFTVRDARGNTYIIKMDSKEYPGLMSSSEVIATNIYYASGYHVPQNSITFFDPEQLVLGQEATVSKREGKQPMTEADLQQILQKGYYREDGKMRVLASKYVEGRPLGPWSFKGKREDDPNDRIPHEDRREVRGLRVLASWLNDTDRRHANTLASYVTVGGRSYVRHYLLDMGSTLGTGGTALRHIKRGQEYRYDPRYMGLLYASLGLYVKPWARPEAVDRPFYASVGYFESQLFSPENWVTSYPNPAFEKLTARDGFWGAKLVMAFSDEEVRAIVESGKLPDPEAEEYLVRILKERRDKIGRYWFGRINPLDQFKAQLEGSTLTLTFSDLGIEGKLFKSDQTAYKYSVRLNGEQKMKNRWTNQPVIELDTGRLIARADKNADIFQIRIATFRDGEQNPGKKTTVYVTIQDGRARVAGLSR